MSEEIKNQEATESNETVEAVESAVTENNGAVEVAAVNEEEVTNQADLEIISLKKAIP